MNLTSGTMFRSWSLPALAEGNCNGNEDCLFEEKQYGT